MITRTGWTVLVIAALTIAAGRLLGLVELFVIGAAMAALVGAAVVYVRLLQVRLEVTREIVPTQLHVGQSARVDLRVTNRGRGRTPLLRLDDPVQSTKGARLHVASLRADETARAAYRLPTGRRGIVEVGPLTVTAADPFQLAGVRLTAAPFAQLVVLPQVDVLAPAGGSAGRDPRSGSDIPNAIGRQGDEFHSLRPYVTGDDLRRVHWASSARSDELMVRTDEVPHQGRCTIVLDVRRSAYADTDAKPGEETARSGFELAVSAAASVAFAAWRHSDLVRLITTDGTDLTAPEPSQAVLEHLATVKPSANGSFTRLASGLRPGSVNGALVCISGHPEPADLDALVLLQRRHGSLTAVFCEPDAPAAVSTARLRVVRVGPNRTLPEAWAAVHGQSAHKTLAGSR